MSRSPIPLVLALFALAISAVPAAAATSRDHHAALRIQGVCTQQSTSKLKLSREDRGVELEFQVDQNRNGVPWTVKLSRNGRTIRTLAATTRAPSGSFEIRRVIAGWLGTDHFAAVATRAAGEICTAGTRRANANPAIASGGGNVGGHDAGDDHGHHSGGHS